MVPGIFPSQLEILSTGPPYLLPLLALSTWPAPGPPTEWFRSICMQWELTARTQGLRADIGAEPSHSIQLLPPVLPWCTKQYQVRFGLQNSLFDSTDTTSIISTE